MAGKYLGLDRANQLAGAAVQLTRAVTNGLGTMPQGAEGIIDNKIGFVKDGKLRFKGKGCKTCGFQWSVANLNYTDLKLIDVSIGDIAEPLQQRHHRIRCSVYIPPAKILRFSVFF